MKRKQSGYKSGNNAETRFLLVSTILKNWTQSGYRSGNEADTCLHFVSSSQFSKISFEVLRLGLGEPRSPNPRSSNKTLPFDLIPSNMRAPIVEYANTW